MTKHRYLDLKQNEWYCCQYPLPRDIYNHSSIVINNRKVIVMGGKSKHIRYDYVASQHNPTLLNSHWQFRLSDIFHDWTIKWNIRRLIWIAHLKNCNKALNPTCFLGQIPKDVVNQILSFL